MHLHVETPINLTPRVQQVRGMFDLPEEAIAALDWHIELPLDERPWHIGLIVGPSGCGKSTVARHLFPELADLDEHGHPTAFSEWIGRGAVVDAFPETMPIKEIVALLSSVGFASPPAWLRPFHVLSTGQRFRVTLTLLLAHTPPEKRIIFDEYTSVVDRTVARIGSAALAKTIRQTRRQFVAVTCHEDVEAWLQPDWVYRPAENTFAWRRLRRRPPIVLDVVRCRPSAWRLFAPHHYLNTSLARSAVCFLALWQGRPVAFSAWLPFVGAGPKARREHRTVTLPDYQGAGIGNALSDFCAGLWSGLGYRVYSTTTHPAMIRSRLRSPNWQMHRAPSFARGHEGRLRHAVTRLTAGFTFVGSPLPRELGRALIGSRQARPTAPA
ncbi:MAG: ABC transporter ATP-binding protein [Planctomycetes bacterium]|nr:ABC transporter ATP-binding protein [Planctomycetota bacterium]